MENNAAKQLDRAKKLDELLCPTEKCANSELEQKVPRIGNESYEQCSNVDERRLVAAKLSFYKTAKRMSLQSLTDQGSSPECIASLSATVSSKPRIRPFLLKSQSPSRSRQITVIGFGLLEEGEACLVYPLLLEPWRSHLAADVSMASADLKRDTKASKRLRLQRVHAPFPLLSCSYRSSFRGRSKVWLKFASCACSHLQQVGYLPIKCTLLLLLHGPDMRSMRPIP
jgi:hypothetical protein